MTELLEQLLKNLKLRRILEIYDEQLRAADKGDISCSAFVTTLISIPWVTSAERYWSTLAKHPSDRE
jgi:hypothetical protein